MVGTFDPQTGKFIPESHQLLNTGPASACPVPGKPGEVTVVSNQGGGYTGKGGGNWNGVFTLPRTYGLGEFDQLTITRAGNTDSLRGAEVTPGNPLPLSLAPGGEVVFDGIGGNALEIIAEIDPGHSSLIELNVLLSPDAKEATAIRLYRDGKHRHEYGCGKRRGDRGPGPQRVQADGHAAFKEHRDPRQPLYQLGRDHHAVRGRRGDPRQHLG